MVDKKKIQKHLLKREEEILKAMPDRKDESIKRAMRLIALEVGKIFKEVLSMKTTRFKITRHATGKTTTTKTGSKKMSAKSKLDGKVANTGTPDRKGKRKSKKRNLPD